MRILLQEPDTKAQNGQQRLRESVVYRLGREEEIQLSVLNEGGLVTVRIRGGPAKPGPSAKNGHATARHSNRGKRNGQVRRAHISKE